MSSGTRPLISRRVALAGLVIAAASPHPLYVTEQLSDRADLFRSKRTHKSAAAAATPRKTRSLATWSRSGTRGSMVKAGVGLRPVALTQSYFNIYGHGTGKTLTAPPIPPSCPTARDK
jgi:hypothetical protein